MGAAGGNRAYRSLGASEAGDAARLEVDAASIASTTRTDAVTGGLVRSGDRFKGLAGRSEAGAHASRLSQGRSGAKGGPGPKKAQPDGDGSLPETGSGKTAMQASAHLRAAIAGAVEDELDDSEELDGAADLGRSARSVAGIARGARPPRRNRAQEGAGGKRPGRAPGKQGGAISGQPPRAGGVAGADARTASPGAGRAKPARRAKGGESAQRARARMQSRRTWLSARARQSQAAGAAARVSGAARRAGGAKALAAAASSAAAPLAGVLAGVLCFVLCALLVSQLVSSLFGFWDNEAKKASLEGLPPYITAEMVEAALECQEKYGHPAGCTLAQIICESGMGDHLSGLATQDKNLFGIKWASSFLGCSEVSGKSSWSTQEEYDGQTVTVMADFTSFKSYEDCIVFRSRVLLANSRYADNALIKQAIAGKDSDKMAEGLKDAGYATSSAYVESLKSAMDTYGLRRFDGISLGDYKKGSANGNAVVAAAMTQIGVPYVWGGTTPGVGLDCSGLTQYAYRQAGISIPRNSEDQAAAGRKVPLSQARPGDILWRPGHVAIYAGGDTYIHEPHTGASCTTATGIAYFTCAVRF